MSAFIKTVFLAHLSLSLSVALTRGIFSIARFIIPVIDRLHFLFVQLATGSIAQQSILLPTDSSPPAECPPPLLPDFRLPSPHPPPPDPHLPIPLACVARILLLFFSLGQEKPKFARINHGKQSWLKDFRRIYMNFTFQVVDQTGRQQELVDQVPN